MTDQFLTDAAKLSSLSATKQGRVSLGGFAYQIGYTVSRLAAMAAGTPNRAVAEIPRAVRFDWAEDVDEVLPDGRVMFTQCKRSDEACRPARIADVLLGFAPKWLWTPEAQRDAVSLQLVSPDPRFGRVTVRAQDTDLYDKVRETFEQRINDKPADTSDRALWQDEALALGAERLLAALWSSLRLVYVDDALEPADPAGIAFKVERDALNALLAAGHLLPAAQRDALTALRTTIHGNVIEFDPLSADARALPHAQPRVIERADVLAALFQYRPDLGGPPPFVVADQSFLQLQRLVPKRPFVAQFPTWADVSHGEDQEIGFIERDETEILLKRVRTEVLEPAASAHPSMPALVLVGAPGSGKSTLVRRVAARLALEGACVIADPGIRLGQLDDDEVVRLEESLRRLADTGHTVLLVLDDPLFQDSPWPRLLRRVARAPRPRIGVLAASPRLLYDQFAGSLPRVVSAQTHTLGAPTDSERRRLARVHHRRSDALLRGSGDFLALSMEAATNERFDDVIQGIWQTLNGGLPIDPDQRPEELPWRVRAFLAVSYFERVDIKPTAAQLQAILAQSADSPDVTELSYRLKELQTHQGWHLFRLYETTDRFAWWTGPTVGTTHPSIARAAWRLRPAPAQDVAEWVAPTFGGPEPGANELGQLAGFLLLTDKPEAERLLARLREAWRVAAQEGRADVRSLAILVSAGVKTTPRFPRFNDEFLAAARAGGPMAWLAAYALYLNSSLKASSRVFRRELDLVAIIREANFAFAARRAGELGLALASVPDALEAFQQHVAAAIEGEFDDWQAPGELIVWFVSNASPELVKQHMQAILDYVETHEKRTDVRQKLLAFAAEQRGDVEFQRAILRRGRRWSASATDELTLAGAFLKLVSIVADEDAEADRRAVLERLPDDVSGSAAATQLLAWISWTSDRLATDILRWAHGVIVGDLDVGRGLMLVNSADLALGRLRGRPLDGELGGWHGALAIAVRDWRAADAARRSALGLRPRTDRPPARAQSKPRR